MTTLQKSAITRAYNIFKKGTHQTNFDKAYKIIENEYPILFTDVIIQQALVNINKYNNTQNEKLLLTY